MNYDNFYIGYEFEFCHENSSKDLKNDLERVLGTIFWCSKQKRHNTDNKSTYPFNYFTLYHDDTVDCDYG